MDARLDTTYAAWSNSYDTYENSLIMLEEMPMRSLFRTMPGRDVLDAATGTGRHALHLAAQGWRVSAIDASAEMLVLAREKAAERKLSIQVEQQDLAQLSFADSSFDLVVCSLALAHIQDLLPPCRELLRVLRPGGNLLISDMHPYFQAIFGPEWTLEVDETHHYFPAFHAEIDAYTDALRAADAEVVMALETPSDWQPPKTPNVAVPGVLIVWAKRKIGNSR